MSDRQMKGILGTKLGMTQVFDENNRVVPVTVVKAGPNVVTQIRTAENDGYAAVQLAFGAIDPRKVNKPRTGHFDKAGVTPRRFLAELRTTDVTGVVTLPEGTEMVMPGDNTEMTVELIQPIAMEEGLLFAIREGGRTVGSGRVIRILK